MASDAELRFAPESAGALEPFDLWMRENHLPIRSLVSDDFADLEPLREILADARIVQLGESGHGMAETSLIKSRLVRFLHAELGFDAVLFESSLYQCFDADRGAGGASPRATMLDCLFGVWHTSEVLPLFEYLRATRDGSRPLRLAGIDVQPIGPNKDHRPEFFADLVATVDPEYAARVRRLDEEFLAEYGKGGRSRRAWFREHRERLLDGYEQLAVFLSRNVAALQPRHESTTVTIAAQVARSMAAYVRQQTAPDARAYAETRDRGMADNVRFLLEGPLAGRKVVVWGHNVHVWHAGEEVPVHEESFADEPTRGMGSWLREWYGDALYTVGVYAYAGTAVDNAREVYEVIPPSAGSLEALLALSGRRVAFVDLSRLRLGPDDSSPLRRELTARYNGLYPQPIFPPAQYDALLFLARVSPPEFLY